VCVVWEIESAMRVFELNIIKHLQYLFSFLLCDKRKLQITLPINVYNICIWIYIYIIHTHTYTYIYISHICMCVIYVRYIFVCVCVCFLLSSIILNILLVS